MSNGECWVQGRHTGDGQASSRHLSQGVEPVMRETMVEQVFAAIGRGETLSGIALAYGLDRKTVRAWSRRGAHHVRVLRVTALVDSALSRLR